MKFLRKGMCVIEATNKQLTMAQVNENNKRLDVTRADISSDKELTSDEKASKKEVEKLKTESTNIALISSLISKYQTEANKAVLQNLAETIFKDITYEVEVKDTVGNGNNKHKTNLYVSFLKRKRQFWLYRRVRRPD